LCFALCTGRRLESAMGKGSPHEWIEAPGQDAHWGAKTEFEREVACAGFRRIAGVDEAGRGPLAGPIVAAAVILSEPVSGLNDSKQLTQAQREALYETLQLGSHGIGVSVVDVGTIDAQGIQSANYAVMAQAVAQLDPPPDFLLVDGFAIRGCAIPQKGIVRGDQRSLSIAAASIIAKVTRDRIMHELDVRHPEYGFARHKGYGTRAHLEALRRYGPCAVHRKTFAPLAQWLESGFLFQERDLHP